MSPSKVAVVTGANRGLGLAICQSLATTFSTPLTLYALSRTGADLKIRPSSSFISIKYGQVDIADAASVDALAKRVEKEHGGCDVLINNAGIYHYMMDPTPEQRNEMINVNYRGTLRMCQAFLPIMNPKGRIVNVSSANGELQHFGSESLRARFRHPDITLQDIEQLAQEYETASAQGTAHQQGWPRKTYALTKALETTLSVPLARENPGCLINACCPGWCSTDLGNQGGTPPKTMDEGARVPLRLGFGDIGGMTGRYWANNQIWDKGEGRARGW